MKKLRLLMLSCAVILLGSQAFAQTTVSISAPDAAAGERLAGQSANPGLIRIARTGSTAGALTVWMKAVSGTGVRGTDYNFGIPVGATLMIPAGSSSLDIPVHVLDDWLTEGTETARLELDDETASGTNVPYAIGTDRAIVNIADNEDPLAPPRAILTVAAVDAVATETPGGTDPAVFRITRTNNLAPELSVLFTLGGTAAAGVDYATLASTITIPAGVGSVDVAIEPIDDALIEPAKTVAFTLLPTDIVTVPLPAEAYALGLTTTATATIVSDDLPPAPVVTMTSPGPSSAAASGQPLAVHFTASAVDGYIVSYTVFAGGAAGVSGVTDLPASTPAGTLYTGTTSVILTGAYTSPLVSVRVTNSNGVSATSAAVAVYVFNAPPPPPPPPVLPIINIYALDADGAEVAAGSPNTASFRVTHDFPATSTVGFLYAMGGTAKEGVDYTLSSAGAVSGSFLGRWFSFPAGTTEAEIVVTPVEDLLIENTETLSMSLYEPPFIGFNEGGPQGFDPGSFGFYWGPNYSASVNLLSDDTTPPPFPVVTIAATDALAAETQDGSDPSVFTVTRTSGPTDVPLTVNYALVSIPPPYPYIYPVPAMAQNGSDFPMLTGTVTIPVGATSTDIVVVPSYDGFAEPSESLRLTLRPSATVWPDPAAYVLDDGLVATAIIRDATLAPGTPVVSIRASDSQAIEENVAGRTASFVVQRSGSLTDAVTVAYTIGGTATPVADYASLSGTVTIPAGLAGAYIVVDPVADGVTEPTESVAVTLQAAPSTTVPLPYALSGASTVQRSAGVSIRDTAILPGYGHLSPRQRIVMRRLHNRHVIVPRPLVETAPAPSIVAAVAPTSWIVEASTDLVSWVEIGTVQSIDEVDEFVDVNAGNFDSRYYRFRSVEPATP